MSTFTKSPEELRELKAQKLEAIRSYHMDLIRDLGVSPLDFNMKMGFYDFNRRYVVGVFASEFGREKGSYFEMINRDYEPLHSDRKVYRIPPNSSFQEEYEMNDKGTYYMVPVDELRIVNTTAVAISKSSAVTSTDRVFSSRATPAQETPKPASVALEDIPYAEMTIRDYIAIHTGRPVSTKSWINELVSKPYNNLPF